MQRELGASMAASVAYVGSQGRNLFLRSVANRTIGVQSNGAARGTQIREFDIVTRERRTARHLPDAICSVPFAEVDYKTSGGHDSYNAMQLSLTRRSANGVVAERSVHPRLQQGQHRRIERSGDGGQQRPDPRRVRLRRWLQQLRRAPHVQLQRALQRSRSRARSTGGWTIGGIANARSGLPVPVLDHAARHRLRRRQRASSGTTLRRTARRSSIRRAAAPRAARGGPM